MITQKLQRVPTPNGIIQILDVSRVYIDPDVLTMEEYQNAINVREYKKLILQKNL